MRTCVSAKKLARKQTAEINLITNSFLGLGFRVSRDYKRGLRPQFPREVITYITDG